MVTDANCFCLSVVLFKHLFGLDKPKENSDAPVLVVLKEIAPCTCSACDDDDDMRAFRRNPQHEAIPETQQYCLTVQDASKLNKTVPISRRLTVWAQPPQITILAP